VKIHRATATLLGRVETSGSSAGTVVQEVLALEHKIEGAVAPTRFIPVKWNIGAKSTRASILPSSSHSCGRGERRTSRWSPHRPCCDSRSTGRVARRSPALQELPAANGPTYTSKPGGDIAIRLPGRPPEQMEFLSDQVSARPHDRGGGGGAASD